VLHGAVHRQEPGGLEARDAVEVQLAYAIGVAEPVSVNVNTFGTGAIPDDRFTELGAREFLADAARHHRHPQPSPSIYRKTAAFGHFGRTEEGFTWEVADKAEALKESAAAVHASVR